MNRTLHRMRGNLRMLHHRGYKLSAISASLQGAIAYWDALYEVFGDAPLGTLMYQGVKIIIEEGDFTNPPTMEFVGEHPTQEPVSILVILGGHTKEVDTPLVTLGDATKEVTTSHIAGTLMSAYHKLLGEGYRPLGVEMGIDAYDSWRATLIEKGVSSGDMFLLGLKIHPSPYVDFATLHGSHPETSELRAMCVPNKEV